MSQYIFIIKMGNSASSYFRFTRVASSTSASDFVKGIKKKQGGDTWFAASHDTGDESVHIDLCDLIFQGCDNSSKRGSTSGHVHRSRGKATAMTDEALGFSDKADTVKETILPAPH